MNVYKVIDIIEKEPEVYAILKYCPYEILKRFVVKEYKKGMFILNQEEVYDTFYIMVEGTVDIYVMSEAGKKYSLARYKKGNYIGEHEIFERKPYSCYVEGLSNIKLLELDRNNFLKWFSLDRNLNEYITKTLCSQFYMLSKKAGKDTLYTLKQKICQYLIDNVSNSGNKTVLKINIEKDQLSEQLAVTQRSVNRVLKDLKEQDIIEIESNFIIIRDFDKLKSIVDRVDS